jgi:hypothetical protein
MVVISGAINYNKLIILKAVRLINVINIIISYLSVPLIKILTFLILFFTRGAYFSSIILIFTLLLINKT